MVRSRAGWACLGSVLGLAAALAVVASAELATARVPAAGPETRLRAIADSGGGLKTLLVHYDPRATELFLPALRDLVAGLDPTATKVIVAVAQTEHFRELSNLLPRQDRLLLEPVVVGRTITGWSRDRFLTATRQGRAVLVVPPQAPTPVPSRANDWLVPFRLGLARPASISLTKASFAFDGGDFVADEERIYATAVLAARNRGTGLESLAALRGPVAALTGLEPVLIGQDPSQVPAHHIGMFLTPLGGGTVLVGDPGGARDILAQASHLDLAVEPDLSEATSRRFEAVAQSVERAGLQVVSIPLLPTTDDLVYISYNNVLIDDRRDGRHVFVPSYGVPLLDQAGAEAWQELGFITHRVDVSGLYRHGGAVRCIAAVVEREG